MYATGNSGHCLNQDCGIIPIYFHKEYPMAKRKRRTFTAEFKAEVVLEALTGKSSQAEVCRRHNISDEQLKVEATTTRKCSDSSEAGLREEIERLSLGYPTYG